MFQDLSSIKEAGFSGFKTVEQLWHDYSLIPDKKGVYLILNPDCTMKQFLLKGVGGYFKGKDPNLSIPQLISNWVDNSYILYIGQAGGNGSSATLRKRIRQYLEFGKGKPVGHYGGRLIWQLTQHKELIVAWKILESSNPRKEEANLLKEFFSIYEKLPFANLSF
jgi:hypothetical protein